jgi:hypothetical protein
MPCWLLQYGGDPLMIARKIAGLFETFAEPIAPQESVKEFAWLR